MFTENLSAFFDASEHGTAITYTPPGYPPGGAQASSLVAIVDKNAVEVDAGGEVQVRGTRTMITCAASDVSGLKRGAHFGIGSDIFQAKDFEYDETETIVNIFVDKVL